ncbi:1-phosphatidylinositol 4,5-bisphosphate phosphodiesterase gamma-2 [Cyclospora cayetanensis]|uniref:Phosphoinositide phospholipase C n=1 Tax=Cyclospora cayetanensis TaxID=88456 RepID=A0A6P6S209_9EIME|nr:1-phosphatidylinositol 4,5-bisphosphate phosphodiesterase gamma-2 [Cyclospora cayetanensis]
MMRELLVQPDIQLYFDLFKLPTEAFISEEGYSRFLREVQGVDTPRAIREELEAFRAANDAYKQTRPDLGVCLTLLGFNTLLCSSANSLMDPQRQMLHQSLSHPLCDYWINSSHNTYLCGDQVVGRSAVGQYIDLLLSGCRCVELDCWNGGDGEPVLFHGVGGYQLTGRIRFRDVIQACKDYGFQRSRLPIILSLEMHCTTNQKARITEIISEILGDSVYRCHPTTPLPSPERLLGCFLIKSKVLNELGEFIEEGDEEDIKMDALEIQLAQELESANLARSFLRANENVSGEAFASAGLTASSASPSPAVPPNGISGGTEAAIDAKAERAAAKLEKLKAFQRNICLRGRKLRGFDQPRNPMDICSMNESKLLRLAKQSPLELCLFHQKYLSRIYPAGTRLSSSNFDPTISWNLGSQIVALNLQSMGLATMLNHGRFQENGGAHGGYVLKPPILRSSQQPFDAVAATPTEPQALHVTIRVVSAHQLPRTITGGRKTRSAAFNKLTSRSKPFQNPFVTVSVHGSRRDTRSFRTPAVSNNSFNPRWANEEATFEFLVTHPSLALLLFRVYTADVRPEMLCFACMPIDAIRSGLRWLPLYDRAFRLLRFSGILVFVRTIHVKQPGEAACLPACTVVYSRCVQCDSHCVSPLRYTSTLHSGLLALHRGCQSTGNETNSLYLYTRAPLTCMRLHLYPNLPVETGRYI